MTLEGKKEGGGRGETSRKKRRKEEHGKKSVEVLKPKVNWADSSVLKIQCILNMRF